VRDREGEKEREKERRREGEREREERRRERERVLKYLQSLWDAALAVGFRRAPRGMYVSIIYVSTWGAFGTRPLP
jgi:hypothetical protein